VHSHACPHALTLSLQLINVLFKTCVQTFMLQHNLQWKICWFVWQRKTRAWISILYTGDNCNSLLLSTFLMLTCFHGCICRKLCPTARMHCTHESLHPNFVCAHTIPLVPQKRHVLHHSYKHHEIWYSVLEIQITVFIIGNWSMQDTVNDQRYLYSKKSLTHTCRQGRQNQR